MGILEMSSTNLSVKMMSAIAMEAEKVLAGRPVATHILPEVKQGIEDTVAHAACEAAEDVKAKVIVAFTHSGNTARNISKYHPTAPIVALTPREQTCRRLSLSWGVEALMVPDMRNTDAMIELAEKTLIEANKAASNDVLVIVAGVPLGVKGNTNLIKLHQVK